MVPNHEYRHWTRWADLAWRVPVAVFIRAPVMLIGVVLEAFARIVCRAGDAIPGLSYSMPWHYLRRQAK